MKGVERLFYLVNLLRSDKKLKAKSIASLCGVTERQIYRDLNLLSSMGIPLYFEKDGYKLLSEAFLPSLNFSLEEALAIKLGLSQPALASMENLKEAVKTASVKLESILNPELSKKLKNLDKKIVFFVKNHEVEKLNTKIFSQIEEAVANSCVIEIEYYALSTKETTKRIIEPYGITFKKNFWYLIGHCQSRGECRTFRINRITKIRSLNKNFTIPRDFSLEEYFLDSWELYRGEKTKIKIKFSPKVSCMLREVKYHPNQKVTFLKDNSAILEIEVAGLDEIASWLLSFGGNIKVLEPLNLKEKILKSALAITRLYQKPIP